MSGSVCVIGAGPSGLVTAKTLQEEGFDVSVFERENDIGGTFRYRTYDDCWLVSSKFLTPFSDFRLAAHSEDHLKVLVDSDRVPLQERLQQGGRHDPNPPGGPKLDVEAASYCDYLHQYALHFGLFRLITFQAAVEAVTKTTTESNQSGYHVTVGGKSHEFDYVVVCSGVHVTPNIPKNIEALDSFTGQILHSSVYRSASMFANQRVLILGAGETSMDIAHHARITSDKAVTIACRGGFLSFPKAFETGPLFPSLPIDTLISNLFDNAYVHRWIRRYRVRWTISDWVVRLLTKVATGSSCGFDQHAGNVHRCSRAYHFLNKSTKALPYINQPFKRRLWWQKLLGVSEPVPDRSIDLKKWPTRVHGKQVFFSDGSSLEVDTIVMASGYSLELPFLKPLDLSDESISDARRFICPLGLDDPSLGMMGMVRPNVGAIPPMAEIQCQWWAQAVRGRLVRTPLPHHEDYHLLRNAQTRLRYGVDYSTFMYELALDIGSAPSLSALVRYPRVLLSYVFGAAFVSAFRLTGPFAIDEAKTIMADELSVSILRRGWLGNAMMALVPMLFYGLVNLLCVIVDTVTMPVRRVLGCAPSCDKHKHKTV